MDTLDFEATIGKFNFALYIVDKYIARAADGRI